MHHGFSAIKHAFVHIDINDLSAAFYLLAGHLEGLFVFGLANEPRKFGRAGDIGAFTYIDK